MSSAPPPPPYIILAANTGSSLQPPPYRRNVSYFHSTKKGGNCCVKCLCCCYCLLFLLIFILACVLFYFYTFFKPQMPSYQVQDLQVKTFELQPDFSLLTDFLVSVKAENPNDKIGFIYEGDNSVMVYYKGSMLCSGHLPSFHQGHQNTTNFKLPLKGRSEFGSGLQEAFMQNKKNRRIPLLVQVKVPVSVVLLHIPLRHFKVFINCSLVVDNLSPNNKIEIVSSNYNMTFSF